MTLALSREATRLGVTRQSPIKVWIADKLDHSDHSVTGAASRPPLLAAGRVLLDAG
jgi:hypothetical protein